MSLYEELREGIWAHDRARGWRRRRCDLANWTDKGLARFKSATVGSQCIIDGTNLTRWVDKSAWDEPNYGITNAELARAYMRHCRRLALFRLGTYKGDMLKKCFPWRKQQLVAFDKARAPLYFDGEPRNGEWALMDVKACYPSLYVPVGLAPLFLEPDEDYPHYSLGVSEVIFDRPEEWVEHKGPRTALFGVCGLRGELTVLDRGQERHVPAFNDCFSPSLVAWTLYCANALARDLIDRFGFVTWATDGGMLPANRANAAAAWASEKWGLALTARAVGEGTVWHATSYSVGDVSTAQEERVPGQRVDSILPGLDPEWFADRLAWARSTAATTRSQTLLPAEELSS